MTTMSNWIQGSRPRTLPTAIAPVAVGCGLAAGLAAFHLGRALLALVVAIALQVGVNYANDYSDGIRGTDRERVGPVRLVGQGLASPRSVKLAAFASFGVAMIAGLVLVASIGQWWLIAVGVACVAAAWLYTGGPAPYGYLGLGEVFVFIFFGPVPTLGTVYVQALTITPAAVVVSIAVGLLACGVLVSNNLRDIPTDATTGKRTLAVRLGDHRTRTLYVGMILAAAVCTVVTALLLSPWLLLTLLVFVLAVGPVRAVVGGATGRELIPVLKGTGILVLGYGLVVGAAIAFA